MFLIPLGLPLLYGFLVKGGPWWSAVCAYVVGAITSLFVNFYLNRYRGMGLNETYLIGIPAITTTIAFFVPVLLIKPAGEFAQRVDAFFRKLTDSDRYGHGTWSGWSFGPRTTSAGGKGYDRNGSGVFSACALRVRPGRDRLIVSDLRDGYDARSVWPLSRRVECQLNQTRRESRAMPAETVPGGSLQLSMNFNRKVASGCPRLSLNFKLACQIMRPRCAFAREIQFNFLRARSSNLLLPAHGFGYSLAVRSVWAVNDGEKIERDDLNNPNKSTNSAWDGHKIKIFGARNEIIAFQLIVEADNKGIDRFDGRSGRVVAEGRQGAINYTAPALDPTNYAGRPIQIFSVNYMNVETPSHAEWVYQVDSPAAPKNPTGWKPVQLIPENARSGRGGFPLKVPGDSNQAIWIEIYTSKSLPAGSITER